MNLRGLTMLFLLLSGHLGAENWNSDWQFRREGEAAWQPCTLPHSEATPYFLGSHFRCGVVEYRKELVVPESWSGKRICLDVEAAFQDCCVCIDGHEATRHRGGYTSFRADLTPWASPGRHVVSIRVDNSWQPTLAPRAGEHVFAAGLYRDLHLSVLPPVHPEHRGICITTPEVSHERARVVVLAELINTSCEARQVRLSASLPEAGVQAQSPTTTLPGNSRHTLRLELPPLHLPRLWSPETPHLYRLELSLCAEGQPEWLETHDVGLRWFEWRAHEGFFLNGQHLFLLGANVHQGIAGWGDAATNASHERDVRLMKEAGFNFIRGSHYPHDPAFLQACDRLGMLYWSEGGIWGMGGAQPGNERWNAPAIPADAARQAAFEASAAAQLREMVRDARNHPCVIAWSVCNEPFFIPAGHLPALRGMLSRLVDTVRAQDPTRPVAIGGAQRGGIDHLGDIAGYNGDGARLFTNPGVPSLVSEYGSASEQRPGRFAPHFGDFANKCPAWRAGAAIWCGFDHGSIWESGQYMGIVDFFRLPKQSWYWYRQALRGLAPAPVPPEGEAASIRLSSDRAELRSCQGEDDVLIHFQLLDREGKPVSAANPVTLTTSEEGVFPTGQSIRFAADSPIRLAAGAGAITLRATQGGVITVTATAPGLNQATLQLRSTGATPTAPVPPTPRHAAAPAPQTATPKATAPALPDDLAQNRPCRASSHEQSAPLATDGDPASVWQAAEDDTSPTLTLDLEFIFPLGLVQVEGTQPLQILSSPDGQQWYPFRPGAPARHLRLRFPRGAQVSNIIVQPAG